jgi:ketosteroid isomerase-like protein
VSREDVDVIRRLFAAFNEGDLTGLLDLMSDDFVLERPYLKETYRGKEGYLKLATDWSEGFSDWWATPEELVDAGDGRVVVRIRQVGVGESSGIEVAEEYGFLYEVRDGRAARLEMHVDFGTALRAAGMPGSA